MVNDDQDYNVFPQGFKIGTGFLISSTFGTLILILLGYINDENFPNKNLICFATFAISWILWYSAYKTLTNRK